MRVPLHAERRIFFVDGEDAAAALDAESEDDVLALTPALDLAELVEDELLLALPLVPRHEQCPEPLPRAFVEDDPAHRPGRQPVRRAGGAQARAAAELRAPWLGERRHCYNVRLFRDCPAPAGAPVAPLARIGLQAGFRRIPWPFNRTRSRLPSAACTARTTRSPSRALAIEPTTGETHLRHHISPTGFYRGRKVLKTKADA